MGSWRAKHRSDNETREENARGVVGTLIHAHALVLAIVEESWRVRREGAGNKSRRKPTLNHSRSVTARFCEILRYTARFCDALRMFAMKARYSLGGA
jgi:hypothetical protein